MFIYINLFNFSRNIFDKFILVNVISMFLECNIRILDPQRRKLKLDDKNVDWIHKKSGDEALFMCVWFKLQGPNGLLDRFNKIGLLDAKTHLPFKILTRDEFNKEMNRTCIIF
ncbi:MAG: hypothetical protein Edafosvirus1_77 [Edafosvirus sp.]|uniref:Uncharacterized protein n=1 Tax=Edafosvirus sp. TaxID=2487765 RepID=A0A3G4ZS69_9VIRU|nr:MAG: hypothetical protein Edafosvirus1_77 [Edafosvirus sp.]